MAFTAGDYYRRWIQSIVEGITDHDCIVHEVMLSKDRLTALHAAFKSYGKPLKGSYLATDLSSDIDRFRDIPFVEFSLFEYDEDLREVIFG